MATKILIAGSLVLFAGIGSAQGVDRAVPMSAPPKDGGTYHVATKKWTRSPSGGTGQGPVRVLYNNTAPSGFYGATNAPRDLNWSDEGRLPAPNDPVQGDGYSYRISGFQVGYCVGGGVAPVQGSWDFYNAYTACSDPRRLSPDFSTGSLAVPGNAGTASVDCWLLTFDLSGSSLEFELGADQEANYDGSSSLDNFGWQMHLDNGLASNQLGPILSYDPSGYFGCAALEGDGTQFQAGTCTSPYSSGNFGSGLGLDDQHYNWSPTASSTYPNGCYWFGGYDAKHPASGFWLVVYGERTSPEAGTPYCTAGWGNWFDRALIYISGDNDGLTPDEVITAGPTQNQPGMFFHAAGQVKVPFGCGSLCAGGALRRGNVVGTMGTNWATYAYDGSSPERDLSPFVGQTRYFQYWYRDGAHIIRCGQTINLTNAIEYDL